MLIHIKFFFLSLLPRRNFSRFFCSSKLDSTHSFPFPLQTQLTLSLSHSQPHSLSLPVYLPSSLSLSVNHPRISGKKIKDLIYVTQHTTLSPFLFFSLSHSPFHLLSTFFSLTLNFFLPPRVTTIHLFSHRFNLFTKSSSTSFNSLTLSFSVALIVHSGHFLPKTSFSLPLPEFIILSDEKPRGRERVREKERERERTERISIQLK